MKNNLKKGSLENARKKFLFLGLIITCSMSLVAFKVSSYDFEEVKTSKISVPDDDTVIFFELPKRTPAKQKAAAKAVSLSTERYVITVVVPDLLPIDKEIDMTDLSLDKLGNSEDLFGEEEIDEDIVDPNITITWSRLARTPYYNDCEDVMDREAESLCSYTKIRNLVQQNTVFPEVPRELGLSARVMVTFIIDKEGNIKDVEAVNSEAHKDFIEAAIEGVKSLPRMNPGTQKMRPVNVKLAIPVTFNLN